MNQSEKLVKQLEQEMTQADVLSTRNKTRSPTQSLSSSALVMAYIPSNLNINSSIAYVKIMKSDYSITYEDQSQVTIKQLEIKVPDKYLNMTVDFAISTIQSDIKNLETNMVKPEMPKQPTSEKPQPPPKTHLVLFETGEGFIEKNKPDNLYQQDKMNYIRQLNDWNENNPNYEQNMQVYHENLLTYQTNLVKHSHLKLALEQLQTLVVQANWQDIRNKFEEECKNNISRQVLLKELSKIDKLDCSDKQKINRLIEFIIDEYKKLPSPQVPLADILSSFCEKYFDIKLPQDQRIHNSMKSDSNIKLIDHLDIKIGDKYYLLMSNEKKSISFAPNEEQLTELISRIQQFVNKPQWSYQTSLGLKPTEVRKIAAILKEDLPNQNKLEKIVKRMQKKATKDKSARTNITSDFYKTLALLDPKNKQSFDRVLDQLIKIEERLSISQKQSNSQKAEKTIREAFSSTFRR